MIWKFDACGFDFQSVQLSGIQPELYSVYQAAKAISTGSRNITLANLASPELVTDEAFHLIVCALLLAKYLKPDAARHAQAYIRYIATREGVEKYVEENGARPAAQAQRVLVEKLLRDFPDARRSFEYEDYARRPTVRNASEFITRTLEEHGISWQEKEVNL